MITRLPQDERIMAIDYLFHTGDDVLREELESMEVSHATLTPSRYNELLSDGYYIHDCVISCDASEVPF